MNPRTTGILLVVAVVLGAFLYFYEIAGEEGRRQAEERTKQLFPEVDEQEILAISLQTSDGVSARIERQDEGWALTEPLAFPADAFAADRLASSLADLAREAELDDPQPPEEYGLGAGARLVRFRVGEDEHSLRLGNETPIGSNAYAMVDGDEKIVTVKGFEARSFEKSLADLRERSILDFDRTGIVRIDASWPGGSVALERDPDTSATLAGEEEEGEVTLDRRWHVVAPVAALADQDTVERLLSDLSFLRADDFLDDPPDDETAGLAEPAFEAVLVGAAAEGAEAPSYRIAIGQTWQGEKRLVRAGHPSLYLIGADRLAGFPLDTVEYRHRTLARFRASEAAQVDFFFQPKEGDPVAITSTREDDGWSSSPEPIATGKVERLVAELSQLKAGDILAESAQGVDLVELGLSPPNTIITVFGFPADEDAETEDAESEDIEDTDEPQAADAVEAPERPRLAEIQLGRVEASEWIVARAVGDPVIYRLDYELAEHLPISLDALRNRFLAPEPSLEEEATGAGDVNPEFLSPSQESP